MGVNQQTEARGWGGWGGTMLQKRPCQVQEWKLSGEVQVQGRGPFLLDSRLRGYTSGQVVSGQAGEGLPTDCCCCFFFFYFSG